MHLTEPLFHNIRLSEGSVINSELQKLNGPCFLFAPFQRLKEKKYEKTKKNEVNAK